MQLLLPLNDSSMSSSDMSISTTISAGSYRAEPSTRSDSDEEPKMKRAWFLENGLVFYETNTYWHLIYGES